MCPVCCKASDRQHLGSHDAYTLFRCDRCEVHFWDPMKGPGETWYVSSEDYRVNRYQPEPGAWRFRMFLELKGGTGMRLLDVGCGTGELVAAARDRGYEAMGVDFDPGAIQLARSTHGLSKVFHQDVRGLDHQFRRSWFDVITFFEVLEHLEDPRRFLLDVRRLLKPSGRIAMSVPNRDRHLDTLGDGDLPPHHLSQWNPASLERFLVENGFQVLQISQQPLDSEEVARYLKLTLSRWVGMGLGSTLLRREIEKAGPGEEVHVSWTTRRIIQLKDMGFRAMGLPASFFLKRLSWQGPLLFAHARLQKHLSSPPGRRRQASS